jgi:acyl-CoA thioester hydrolase
MVARMNAERHIYEIVIREGHLDTFGHVNNATYLQIFEEARWELITKNGFGMDKIRETGLGPTILELNLKFIKELRLRQKVRVESYMESYEKKVGMLVQEIKNESGELCTSMRMTFGLFDTRQRKLVLPTPEWSQAIGLKDI